MTPSDVLMLILKIRIRQKIYASILEKVSGTFNGEDSNFFSKGIKSSSHPVFDNTWEENSSEQSSNFKSNISKMKVIKANMNGSENTIERQSSNHTGKSRGSSRRTKKRSQKKSGLKSKTTSHN